jgi:hypothetical protein
MKKFTVFYSRVFNHEIECENMDDAAAKSTNFAIGMNHNLGTGSHVRILSIYESNYKFPIMVVKMLTPYEKLIGGMRTQIDSLLT